MKITLNLTNNNLAELRIIGEISGWKNSSEEVREQLGNLLDGGAKALNIYINSGGGSVFEAMEIVNLIKGLEVPKTARIGALCASAATIIALACDEVEMASNGMMMIHKPSIGVEGNEDDLNSSLNLLQNIQQSILKMYATKTGIEEERLSQLWLRDFWMNADKAKELGFIDKITGEVQLNKQEALDLVQMMNIPTSIYKLAASAITNQNINMDLSEIVKLLDLPENASQEQVVEAIKALKKRAEEAETKEQEATEAKAEALVQAAIESRKIPADKKKAYLKLARADYESAKAALNAMRPVLKPTQLLKNETNTNTLQRNKWSFDDWSKKDPKGLLKMKSEDPERYETLFEMEYRGN